MTLIKWDYKRLIPMWLLMTASMGYLLFQFLENGGLAVYQKTSASRAEQYLPFVLALLLAVLAYSMISLIRSDILVLRDDQFVFVNGPFSKRIAAGENEVRIFLNKKQRIQTVDVSAPDGRILHRLAPRAMTFACKPEDLPPGYKVEVISLGPAGVF